jgi:glycosyltransferase involved in cell wall biosynthesis
LKILYISEIYPDVKHGLGVWGGGEKNFYEISKREATLGNDVSVLTCRFPGQPSTDFIDGVKIYRIGLSREPNIGGALKSFYHILNYILQTGIKAIKIKPDIIHCNTYLPVYAGYMASKLNKVPLVTTFHDIYGLKRWIESQNSIFWGFLGHMATVIASRLHHDRFFSVSPQTKQKLMNLGVSEKKIYVIPNGVDLKLFDSIQIREVPNQVLYVGRLVNYKNVDWLVKAFSEVVKEIPTAKLKIVGDGPERKNLVRIVNKLGLESHVIFTGVTSNYDDVACHFKESSIFVLPSTLEGEGIVIKEAMAAQLPFIAMNVATSGVLSLLKNGENGLLLEPGQPSLIAKKIIQLLQDKEMRIKMGLFGRKFVDNCDWDIIAKRVLESYQELVQEPGARTHSRSKMY